MPLKTCKELRAEVVPFWDLMSTFVRKILAGTSLFAEDEPRAHGVTGAQHSVQVAGAGSIPAGSISRVFRHDEETVSGGRMQR